MSNPAPPTYLALGIPLGALVTPTSPGPRCGLRRGGRYVELPVEAYEYWHLALDSRSEEELRAVAIRQGAAADFADNLQWFVEARLLLPWHGDARDVAHYAHLRVIPCGIGAGNTAAHPDRFTVLHRDGRPALDLDVVGYALWSFCDGTVSLDQACRQTAQHLQVPPDAVSARAGTAVVQWMRQGVAFLDWVGMTP
jgi:hypothetical protein